MLNKILLSNFIILFSLTFANAKAETKNIDLNNIKLLDSKLESEQKTEADYKKKENFLNQPINKKDNLTSKKKDDLNLDGTVDINKDTKTIDSIQINLGKNF
jgi:hypothetical protein